jgi:hypothetical protein
MMQRVLCWLFARIYRKWLWDEYYRQYKTVDKVLGWRTARVYVRDHHRIECVTPCFWIFD